MKELGKLLIQGLIAILPVALTLYILYWLAASAESVLGRLLRLLLPESFYITGMGVVAGLALVMGVGILLRIWLFRKVFEWGEAILERLPLIKSLYGSIRDIISFFDTSKKKSFDKVVMVTVADPDIRLIGFITREDFEALPEGIGGDETLALYLPMSYQMGGFTIFVPKSQVQPVDMRIDEAMRFAFTAGVSTQKQGSLPSA